MAGKLKTAIFRVDAGIGIGSGHITRCLALAKALSDSGFSCAFAVNPEARSIVKTFSQSFECVELVCTSDQEPKEMRRTWPNGCDLLVVDHYGRDARFESVCRGWASCILAIDDLADRKHDCDYLVDASPGASHIDYQELVPSECRLLIGPQYALLRPEFVFYRKKSLSRRSSNMKVKRFFACFGSLDGKELLPNTIDILCGMSDSFEMDVVVGSAAPHIDVIRQKSEKHGKRVRLNLDVLNMAELMSKADLRIGSAGVTALEACCLGLPSIIVATAFNQQRNADGLNMLNAAAVMSLKNSFHFELEAYINGLVGSPQRLQKISRCSRDICDGRGSLRLVLELQSSLITKDGEEVKLRLADVADTETVYKWQEHPQTRAYFRNPTVPSREDHIRWMEEIFSDSERFLFLIEASGRSAGTLRLDKKKGRTNQELEVSVLVDPELHGRGIGKAALCIARAIFPRHDFHAQISPRNKASQALFQSVGFKKVSTGESVNAQAMEHYMSDRTKRG